MRFFCSQTEEHRKKSKPSQCSDAKHRDNVGMKRYPCNGRLSITYRMKKLGSTYIIINLHHHFKHVLYVDVSMLPEAMQMIEEQVEWLTPSAMATKILLAYPQLTKMQIYTAWREHSQAHWHCYDLQIPSAKILLGEYGDFINIFKPMDVPESVKILAWGLKKIADPLKGKNI